MPDFVLKSITMRLPHASFHLQIYIISRFWDNLYLLYFTHPLWAAVASTSRSITRPTDQDLRSLHFGDNSAKLLQQVPSGRSNHTVYHNMIFNVGKGFFASASAVHSEAATINCHLRLMTHHVVGVPEGGNSSDGSGKRHLRARSCAHTPHWLEDGDEVELHPRNVRERRRKYGKGQHNSNAYLEHMSMECTVREGECSDGQLEELQREEDATDAVGGPFADVCSK
ncbi:hypothetical protein EDD15DRAFT_2267090 [Pisolithus albus]|nr:hypothetical protein EDD15DRAFT_2267090 [Pisolithus albus]